MNKNELRVGICGLGFMGKMHFDTIAGLEGVRVSAIATRDPMKRRGDWSGIGGNIDTAGTTADLRNVRMHASVAELIADPEVDVVDITLPTPLHEDTARAALNQKKPVICEKPLALTAAAAARMTTAFAAAKVGFYPAHCIRFWPAYAKLREWILSETYGPVRRAHFSRLAEMPQWSRDNWLNDPQRSGGAALDLHIHDADFVQWVFGLPEKVISHTAGLKENAPDYIHSTYLFPEKAAPLISAEGGWMSADGAGFHMGFRVEFSEATVGFGWGEKPDNLMLYPRDGAPQQVEVAAQDGYAAEFSYFRDCMDEKRTPDLASPESAVKTLELLEAELASAAQQGVALYLQNE